MPLSGEQHSCNEAESGGDADQVELDGETGYGQQARTSWQEALAPELALYKDGERYEGGGEQYRAKQAGMPLSFLFHTKRWH